MVSTVCCEQRKALKTRLSHRVFSCYDNARRIVCDVKLEEISVVNILRAQEGEIKREIPVFLFDVIFWPPKEIFLHANNKTWKENEKVLN